MALSSNSSLLKYNEVARCKIKGTYPVINVELPLYWHESNSLDRLPQDDNVHFLIKSIMLNEPGSFHPPNFTYTLEFPSSLNQWEYSSGVRLIWGLIRSLALKTSSLAYIFRTNKRQALLAHDLRSVGELTYQNRRCHAGFPRATLLGNKKSSGWAGWTRLPLFGFLVV